jgi:hypothetical protein
VKFTDVAVEDLFEDLIRLGRGEAISPRSRVHWTISQLYDLCENALSGELIPRGYRPDQLSSTALHEQLITWIRSSMNDALRRRAMMFEQLYAMKKMAALMPVSAFAETDMHDAIHLAAHVLGAEEILVNFPAAGQPAAPPAPPVEQSVATVAALPSRAAPTTAEPRRPDAARQRSRRERKNKRRK